MKQAPELFWAMYYYYYNYYYYQLLSCNKQSLYSLLWDKKKKKI